MNANNLLLEKILVNQAASGIDKDDINMFLEVMLMTDTRFKGLDYDDEDHPDGYRPNTYRDGAVYFWESDVIFAMMPRREIPAIKKEDNVWHMLTGMISRRPFHFDGIENPMSRVLHGLAEFEQAISGLDPTHDLIPMRIRRLIDICTGRGTYTFMETTYVNKLSAFHVFIQDRAHLTETVFSLFRRVYPDWNPVPWTKEFAEKTLENYRTRVAGQDEFESKLKKSKTRE